MKSDREFLDGIYEKARFSEKLIEEQKSKIINIKPKKSILMRLTAAAAAIVLVATPISIYLNQPQMTVPQQAAGDLPMSIRAMTIRPDAQMLADNSELILTAKITKIEKSVYDEGKSRIITSVKLRPTEIIKGDFTQKNLHLKVNGGYLKKSDAYEPYEAVFEISEDVLLFLKLDEDKNSYILSDGEYSKYSRSGLDEEQSYMGTDDMTISISEITKIVKGE